jgi:hypothetical protein
MGRIRKAYELKFRALLRRVRARRAAQGARWWLAHAADRQGALESRALAEAFRQLRHKVEKWEARAGRRPAGGPAASPAATPPRFLCDAGLGGLARWLRAAGYEAQWTPGISDDALLTEARRLAATVVTTDSMLMERRVLRDGAVPSVWVPPALTMLEQLRVVLDELGLPLRAPRCMSCGGPVRRVDKEAARDRIPPRTYRWLDEYFECARCGKLFWHGTHWRRIQERLRARG